MATGLALIMHAIPRSAEFALVFDSLYVPLGDCLRLITTRLTLRGDVCETLCAELWSPRTRAFQGSLVCVQCPLSSHEDCQRKHSIERQLTT